MAQCVVCEAILECLVNPGAILHASVIVSQYQKMSSDHMQYALANSEALDISKLSIQRLIANSRLLDDEVEVIRVLLDAGAPVNLRDKYDETPLKTAIRLHKDIEMIRLLLDYGADMDNIDAEGTTALEYAMTLDDLSSANVIQELYDRMSGRVATKSAKG